MAAEAFCIQSSERAMIAYTLCGRPAYEVSGRIYESLEDWYSTEPEARLCRKCAAQLRARMRKDQDVAKFQVDARTALICPPSVR